MATAAYFAWDRDGRPITPARPVREWVTRLQVAFPAAAATFSWYADDAHYQADYPQDHTPYSETPWPVTPNPYPYVFATDIMHRPDLGVDCNTLFAYWLSEAKAGRMPWLKYLIWRARLYHVRNNWAPTAATGHYDHIHGSTRTDHTDTGLGAWSVTPPGPAEDTGDEMIIFAIDKSTKQVYRCNGVVCVPVPDAEVLNQTYVYGGGAEWVAISSKANAVGPWFPTAVQVDGARVGVKSHLAVYDMGFFGEPVESGAAGPVGEHTHTPGGVA